MVFVDIFFPENPEKRRKVVNYQTKFRRSFEDFKRSWNELCTSFNEVVRNEKPDWVLRLLEYNPDSHKENYILNEIKEVLEDTKSKVPKIEQDIGIKNLEEAFKEIDIETIRKVKKALDIAVGVIASSVLIYFFSSIFTPLNPTIYVVEAAIGDIRLLELILVGAVLIAVVGYIERKLLDDAIEACEKFDASCIVHLDNARRKIDGINQNIKDGVYPIDDNYIIRNGVLRRSYRRFCFIT